MNFCLLTNAKPQEHQVVLFWVNQTISEHAVKDAG